VFVCMSLLNHGTGSGVLGIAACKLDFQVLCVCVWEREKERERENVCECKCVWVSWALLLVSWAAR